MKNTLTYNPSYEYERIYPSLSGYTTSYNAIKMGYPFVQSIASILPIVDELIVVDHSDDGTLDVLHEIAESDPKIQVYTREWGDEPGADGLAKSYARALCGSEYCLQFDLDEAIHEEDYFKWKSILKRFPNQADVLHLPVVECWGDGEHVTGRRHPWKWRLSRNNPQITHGINKHARVTDEKTGVVYSKEGMSDGCEMIDNVTMDFVPHLGFYTQEIEQLRQSMPEQYAEVINQAFKQLPSVFHYSWLSLPLKVDQFKVNWDKQWSNLYQKEMPPRFDPEADIDKLISEMYETGGEPCDQIKYKFKLDREHPKVMQDWVDEHTKYVKKLKAA